MSWQAGQSRAKLEALDMECLKSTSIGVQVDWVALRPQDVWLGAGGEARKG
jgi:hypothetical protein